MRKAMKRFLLAIAFVFMFGLMGCGSTLSTELSISDNFAGTRTMDVSIDKETFDEYAPEGGFKTLAEETKEITPECMEFSYEETKDGDYVFHFIMSFTSEEEYENQIAEVLGEGYGVEFIYSKSPFAKGVSLQENFSSEDLLRWFKDYLVDKEYVESEDSAYIFRYMNNAVSINGVEYDCYKNQLNVSQKTYIQIEEINIFTDLDAENGKIARKIEFVFDDYVMKNSREAIVDYLKSVTPEGCQGEWQVTEDGDEKFILVIPACTPENMTLAMQTFCASADCNVQLIVSGEESGEEEEEEKTSYSDMWDEEILGDLSSKNQVNSDIYVQPFGFETTISENLDLNSFVCDSWGEVESSYYISVKNGKPESMIYYPNGNEAYGWDYIEEENPDYYFVESEWQPVYQVVSTVNKYYVPTSTEVNTVVKSEDKMVREFIFMFDEPFEEAVADKIEEKLDALFEPHNDLIKMDIKNKSKNTSITWEIQGSVEEVDALCEEIFGKGYSDISYYCQDRFVLNKQYDYNESVDLRPIFDWEYDGNIDYTVKMSGKIDESNTYITGGVGTESKISGKKASYLSMESGHLNASITGTTSNVALISVVIVIIVFMLAVVAAVAFLIVKASKGQTEKVE